LDKCSHNIENAMMVIEAYIHLFSMKPKTLNRMLNIIMKKEEVAKGLLFDVEAPLKITNKIINSPNKIEGKNQLLLTS